MSAYMTRNQARAVAKILLAFANGKQHQWKNEDGAWVDDTIAWSSHDAACWLKEHRIKPTRKSKPTT